MRSRSLAGMLLPSCLAVRGGVGRSQNDSQNPGLGDWGSMTKEHKGEAD